MIQLAFFVVLEDASSWNTIRLTEVAGTFVLEDDFRLFWTLFPTRNLRIAWDSLYYKTDLDHGVCNLKVELPYERRMNRFVAIFGFAFTWYVWLKKLGQHSTLRGHIFYYKCFRQVLSLN